MRHGILYAGLLLSGCLTSRHLPIPPTPTQWFTDTTKTFSPDVVKALNFKLEVYEQRTKHQVFVWIMDSTHGEPWGEYALRAFNAWGIGRERYDDGVVLFWFVKDDMRWITVGYGLEGAIPDREAVRICREVIAPRMKKGEPAEGIRDGIDAIIDAIDAWEKR